MKESDHYHHGDLRAELLRLGLEALEAEGAEALSLRNLAERAGVSKAAPYRHFPDRELFLGALANEGFRLLCSALEAARTSKGGIGAMGRAYMAFALAHPALYRLMNSPLICRLPGDTVLEAQRSMRILGAGLAEESGWQAPGEEPGSPFESEEGRRLFADAAAATWAYIHGLVLLRIDQLFPRWLPEPDWERLAGLSPTRGFR
jgi:AcrR family transcriptional regulator